MAQMVRLTVGERTFGGGGEDVHMQDVGVPFAVLALQPRTA